MNVEHLAASIVAHLVPNSIAVGSECDPKWLRAEFERRQKEFDEHVLVVTCMICDAMTPEDDSEGE